jgi:hypothetical protein
MKVPPRLRVPVIAVMAAAGCYSYEPTTSPTPGTDIRARLTADAAVRRSQGFDDPILYYDGVVVRSTPDTLAVDVLVARSSTTFQDVEIRDTVRLGAGEIQSIMGRKLSVTKSILVTVGAAAAAFGVIKGIDQVVGGTGDGDDGRGNPALQIPIFRLVGTRLLPLFAGGRQ